MKKMIAAFGLFLFMMPLIGLAHPGHGESGGFTITHYFTEPVHIVISIMVLFAVVVYFRLIGRNRQQKENS